MLESLRARSGPHWQCLNIRCGWSGKWHREDAGTCPRCKGRLSRYPSEAAGWRAFHRSNGTTDPAGCRHDPAQRQAHRAGRWAKIKGSGGMLGV